MKKLLLTLFVLFHAASAFTQVMDTKYFSNKHLRREVPAAKAKYVQVVTKNPDGSITTEVTDIAKNEVINSETYKGKQHVGVWKYQGVEVNYSDIPCSDSIAGLRNFSKDSVSLKYTAPKIAGEQKTLIDFLVHNINYPDFARENRIQGRVLLTLRINAGGIIEEVAIKRGVHISLDAEAVRVMRLLKLASPPMLDGKPVPLCIEVPLTFSLQ